MQAQTIENEVWLPSWARALWEPARHYALYGGRGSAKSHTVARRLLLTGAERTYRVGCGREFQRNIQESVKQLLDDLIIELGLTDYFESTDKEIRGLRNESKFTFLGTWRNPQGIKSMEGYDAFWGEEANRFSQRSLDILVPTLRKEGSCFFWTWNPEQPIDPVDHMFRGNDDAKRAQWGGPPPRSIVLKVNWQDNERFPPDLREAMEAMYASDPDRAEHIYGGEYVKAVEGAYFARELRQARAQGRFNSSIVYDPNYATLAYWDLGRNDATAIWIVQRHPDKVAVIDYCEGSGQAPGYYFNWLRANGYDGCQCILPHDGSHVHPDNPTAMSYESQARGAGFQVRVVRNQGPGAAQQRIDATRRLFPRIHFNEDTTRPGVRALGHYHERIHEQTRARMGPEHDWSSHAADAFGLMAIDWKAPSTQIRQEVPKAKFGTMA